MIHFQMKMKSAKPQNLASKVDLETTSFKKLMQLLEHKLDCNDLTSANSIIQEIYDDGRDHDAKIIEAAKKLARSSKVDLDNISNHKFLRILQDQETVREIDLSPKKDLVNKILKECKCNQHANKHNSMHAEDISLSQSSNNTKLNTRQNADEVMAMSMYHNPHDHTNKKPK